MQQKNDKYSYKEIVLKYPAVRQFQHDIIIVKQSDATLYEATPKLHQSEI